MTEPETEETGESFAEFEASLSAPPKDEPKPEEDVKPDEDEEDDPEASDEDKEEKKRRSKPPAQRISEITAARRQAERERDDALERLAALEGGRKTEKPADLEEPDPDKYEFGEADPQYLRDVARYEVKAELAEEAKKAEATRAAQSQREQAANLDKSWEEKAAKAVEKYADFNEVVVEGAANGDWAAPPLVAVAISASEVGADVAYHLATNPAESRALAAQAQVNPVAAAEEFGKLEGRFLDAEPQLPSGPDVNQLDYARYAGQMRAWLSKPKEEAPKPQATRAPVPPANQARGAGGKFEVDDGTENFAEFERKYMATKR